MTATAAECEYPEDPYDEQAWDEYQACYAGCVGLAQDIKRLRGRIDALQRAIDRTVSPTRERKLRRKLRRLKRQLRRLERQQQEQCA